jgi:hypothetical protein
LRLRGAGIQIARFDPDLMAAAEELNREFARQHPSAPAPDLTSDRSTPALALERPTIREKSAAEILGHLKGITLPSRFRESAEELYLGRWTREPGWQATVHDLPRNPSGGRWHCIFKEVGSGALVMATTVQDISTLRPGDSVTVSGKIADVSRLEFVILQDAIVQGDNVPFP